MRVLFGFLAMMLTYAVTAEQQTIGNTTITQVLVNGGMDSPNSGTTCVSIKDALPAACNGFVAILNNNKELLSAALHAKATGDDVWFYFHSDHGDNHCPGRVFTPCALISVGLK